MKLAGWLSAKKTSIAQRGWRHWLNLREEESERTFLMFAFYTMTSIGILWLEVSAAALFLGDYGAVSLPWIYIASAGIGTGLGFLYSWLQKFLPLRRVIVLTAVLMALPLFLFRMGLHPAFQWGYTVFLMRLWLEAIYVLNELNTSITANQIFNIREIKRTYPLISSGILAADILSGFSLPLLRVRIGLPNVILAASVMLLIGAGILFYLSQAYQQAFPDSLRRRLQERQPDFTARRLRGSLRRYIFLTVAFFVLAQVLSLFLDFQYLSQLERNLNVQVEEIADFLALFSGVLGIFELLTQWFISGRAIERLGVFAIALLPPVLIICLSLFTLSGVFSLFWGLILLKFLDELLRYTLLASIGPVLFQPIPDSIRSRIQAAVRGIAEPISTGFTGLSMLATIWLLRRLFPGETTAIYQQTQSWFFLMLMVVLATAWLLAVMLLRSRYLGLLVMSAERGQLSLSDVDLRTFKRAVVEALDRPGTEADKKSCIELLTHIDPKNVGEVLSPLLLNMPPALQRQSLEAMMSYPNPLHLERVRALTRRPLSPEVLAVALRYLWLTEADPDVKQLRPYLNPEVDPVVRGTAASLMLRRGRPEEKAEATFALKRMLTHKLERERVMGCRALGEAVYLQTLRIHIADLLQDESLRVRCALLEAIAATHLEEYYPSLLRGLNYKSTREAAMRALVRLENEAIPLLVKLAEDPSKSELSRTCAWTAIAQIGTLEALNALVTHLMTAWGATRGKLLRILLKMPQEIGIEAVAEMMGRSGIETLINQELQLMAQLYASLLDLSADKITGREADLLRRALRDMQDDAVERLFLLMRFLYPSSAIQAAAYNLRSDSREYMARGLEILDNTLDLSSKRILLGVLDRRSDIEKLELLAECVAYEPMSPSQRLRYLLELRHFLSDWGLACCFHVARAARWSLTTEQTLSCLHHPKNFVREAVLSYLQLVSAKALKELLPLLKNDPDRLVAAQVQQMIDELGALPPSPPPPRQLNQAGAIAHPPGTPRLKPI